MKKIEIKSNQFQNVLKKAIEKKPMVRLGKKAGLYFVAGSTGNKYAVQFERGFYGAMFGSCLCPGAVRGFHCYHLAAALIVHSAYVKQEMRKPAPTRREMCAAVNPTLGWSGDESVRNLI